jgi:hypothetical protein
VLKTSATIQSNDGERVIFTTSNLLSLFVLSSFVVEFVSDSFVGHSRNSRAMRGLGIIVLPPGKEIDGGISHFERCVDVGLSYYHQVKRLTG